MTQEISGRALRDPARVLAGGASKFAIEACLNIFQTGLIASIGFLCVLFGHFNMAIPAPSGDTLDALVLNIPARAALGADVSYAAQPFLLRYLMDVTITSLLTLMFSLLLASRQAREIFDAIISVSARHQSTLVERGQINLRYDALLSLNATVIFLVVVLVVSIASAAIESGAVFPQELAYLLAPLFLFGGLALFMLLIMDFSILRAYFKHPKGA